MPRAFQNLLVTTIRKIGSDANGDGGIQLDAWIRESTVRSARVTTNPIENGLTISDHVILEPMRFEMEGVVTDTPIGAGAVTALYNTGVNIYESLSSGSIPDIVSGVVGSSEAQSNTRSNSAYLELVVMLKAKELLVVQTSLERISNLVMTSITVDKDKTTANALFFKATFVEALIVKVSKEGIEKENVKESANPFGVCTFESGGVAFTEIVNSADTAVINYSMGKRS